MMKIEIYGHRCEENGVENTLVSLMYDEMYALLEWCVRMKYLDVFNERLAETYLREFTDFVYSCRIAFIESVILDQIERMELDGIMELRTNELRIWGDVE